MLSASVLMLRPISYETPASPRPMWKITLDGLAVGVLTGLVGVGGGFLVVPALVLLGGLKMREAVATSLVIIALKSFSGFYKYLDVLNRENLELDLQIIVLVTLVGVVGSFAGQLLATRIPQSSLKRLFGIFLIIMGSFILLQAAPALLQS
jgi:hypothetical protein